MVYLFLLVPNGSIKKKSLRNYLKDALLLTFSGVKGTVSIATILLIPTKIEKRIPYPTLFLVAGVTLVSFIAGLVVLPKLSEDKEETNDYLMQIAILNDVVMELEADLKNSKHKGPLYAAIDNYHGRIENLILGQKTGSFKGLGTVEAPDFVVLKVTAWNRLMKKKGRFERGYRVYQRYLRNMEQRVNRNL